MIFILISVHHVAKADVVVPNNSMLAASIAEIFVTESGVQVNLEIGRAEVKYFLDILPDTVLKQLNSQSDLSATQRQEMFFKTKFVINDEHNQPLKGRLVNVSPGKRVLRDAIDGFPLVNQKNAQDVIKAVLHFSFNAKKIPQSISFSRLPSKHIGFVLYHQKIAVNDFRYLSNQLVLKLDWLDPWYTSFGSQKMLRQYASPMNGFIYVEPFEVRKEIIVRPKDLQRWVDLGISDVKFIDSEQQKKIKEIASKFLFLHQPVLIDGEKQDGFIESVNFLARTLNTSVVLDSTSPIDINAAVLGVIIVYPRSGQLPKNVVMEWDLWDEKMQLVPTIAVDELGALPLTLDPDWPKLTWTNFIKNPTIATMIQVPQPVTKLELIAYYASYLLQALIVVIIIALLFFPALRKYRNRVFAGELLLILFAFIAFSNGKLNLQDESSTKVIISTLLNNIYRSFDYHDDEVVYDKLEKSIDGGLLTEVYLLAKRSMELENQGGASAKISKIEVEEIELQNSNSDQSFSVQAKWTVAGEVGHWGHTHTRINKYIADLEVKVVNGQWRMTDMKVLNEERI